MQIKCPHCHNAVELVEGRDDLLKTCPSCGSHFTFLDETVTREATLLGDIDQYTLLEHIGQGHFGDVFKARDRQLGRVVALKIPRTRTIGPSRKETFLREARAAARLRPPNIVEVYSVGEANDSLYIASAFIDGPNLAELIRSDRPSIQRSMYSTHKREKPYWVVYSTAC